MSRRYGDDVARADLKLGAVVHEDLLATGHDVPDVRRLAALSPGDRLHVDRPLPAWRESGTAHDTVTDADYLYLTLVRNGRVSSGVVEPLALQSCHAQPAFSCPDFGDLIYRTDLQDQLRRIGRENLIFPCQEFPAVHWREPAHRQGTPSTAVPDT